MDDALEATMPSSSMNGQMVYGEVPYNYNVYNIYHMSPNVIWRGVS